MAFEREISTVLSAVLVLSFFVSLAVSLPPPPALLKGLLCSFLCSFMLRSSSAQLPPPKILSSATSSERINLPFIQFMGTFLLTVFVHVMLFGRVRPFAAFSASCSFASIMTTIFIVGMPMFGACSGPGFPALNPSVGASNSGHFHSTQRTHVENVCWGLYVYVVFLQLVGLFLQVEIPMWLGAREPNAANENAAGRLAQLMDLVLPEMDHVAEHVVDQI